MFAVLGASGNVGGKITEALLMRGEKVRVVGRNPQKLERYKQQGAELYLGLLSDPVFLTKCFKNCEAVFVMLPSDFRTSSLSLHYQKLSETVRAAIQNSGLRYVVNLSSFGTELTAGTGIIQYLREHEQRMNRLESCHVLHLRAAFFMENLLSFIPAIRQSHKVYCTLKADLQIPMVATFDVARVATENLLGRNFNNKSVQNILGPRDVSMTEICLFLSRILKQKINYHQLSDQEGERFFLQKGMSPDAARQIIEMYHAYNAGLLNTLDSRNGEAATSTRIEDFLRAFRGIYFEDNGLGKQTENYADENPPQH